MAAIATGHRSVADSAPRRRLAALLSLCRMLRSGEPPNGPTGWATVFLLAAELCVLEPLWCALRRDSDRLPDGMVEALRHQHVLNAIRNVRLRRDLEQAVEALNAAGIVPLLFKGGLQLLDGTLESVGDRWMADVDVLVPPGALDEAIAVLQLLDYRPEPGKPFLHQHEIPVVREGGGGALELHVELGSAPIPKLLPRDAVWADSFELAVGSRGARARGPSPTHQILYNILHTAVQDLNHAVGGLPLRQLVTLTRLVQVHGSAVDWDFVTARMVSEGLEAPLRDHLWLAHRLTGMQLPAQASGGLRPRLHEARVLANFTLVWPADVERNLRFAFGREYLDSLYGHGNHPLKLAGARARHAARVLQRDARGALREATLRKV